MKKRVRAIIIKNHKILTIERDQDGVLFWALPGGGVENYDENETAALKRECLEEVSLNIDVIQFIQSKEFNGCIEYFYLCKVVSRKAMPGNGPEYDNNNNEYHGRHIPKWLPLKDLKEYDLKPSEIKLKIIKNAKTYKSRIAEI